MEVYDVGRVPVDDAIESLLEPSNLRQLVDGRGALCFALVREITAADFYGQLIENSSTVDSTTREHIAFVVFYGRRSSVVREAQSAKHRYYARSEVEGLSVSQAHDVYLQPQPEVSQIRPEFDAQLGHTVRYMPSEIHKPTLSQQMGLANRRLMERYAVPELALPCLLFVDGSDPTRSETVRLSSEGPASAALQRRIEAPITGVCRSVSLLDTT